MAETKFDHGVEAASPKLEALAKAIFVEEERLLPEGESWESLKETGRSHYINLAIAVLREMRRLRAK
ncbi:MAG: hypothetical protein WDZ83_05290 [Rhizobiaceae bacterium]